ncbi:MAG: SAM-dependent methyltransferase, partial [Chloroflexi bacterium]|nr:SAM-dependent methyltransferase [Chloroflexota bacterium]
MSMRTYPATPAAERIASEIARDGPITFRRFMEIALYDPEVGYYTRAFTGHGPSGDYVTSPELHPAFGALLCVQIEEMWRLLGEPAPFWLVEGGPGSGAFAANVLASAEVSFPRFRDALQVALVERSPALRARQQERLDRWRDHVPNPEPRTPSPRVGCVFANELLDAFPIHRVVITAGGPRELYVTVESGRFAEIAG